MSDCGFLLAAAFGAGLTGSAHCGAMCGGLATVIGSRLTGGPRSKTRAALTFNMARLTSYAIAGAGAAAGIGTLMPARHTPYLSILAHLLAAAMLLALAQKLLTGRDLLGSDQLGAWVWMHARPFLRYTSKAPESLRPAAVGLLWGVMPCGLIYSLLFVAAASGSAARGAGVMLAFGAGTLPVMLGLTLGGANLPLALTARPLRQLVGVATLIAALWTMAMAFPAFSASTLIAHHLHTDTP